MKANKPVTISWAHIGRPNPTRNNRRRMVIFASKLAGCAGMHKYVNTEELRFEFRHALYGDDAIDEIPDGYLPPKEYEEKVKSTGLTTEAKQLVEESMSKITSAEDSTTSSKVVAAAIVKLNAMEGVSEQAKEVVRKDLYTHHGVVGEEAIRVDTAVAVDGREISADNKFVTTLGPILEIDGFDVYVGGRHDGLMKDAEGHEILTEIKNRTRRHLGVPLYERVQLHGYMEIFGIRKGMLIENYRKDRVEHDVYFDDDLWAGVLSSTKEFLESCLMTHSTSI